MHAELDDVVRHQCASWWTDRGAVMYRAAGTLSYVQQEYLAFASAADWYLDTYLPYLSQTKVFQSTL